MPESSHLAAIIFPACWQVGKKSLLPSGQNTSTFEFNFASFQVLYSSEFPWPE
jgi:hypothetical protein